MATRLMTDNTLEVLNGYPTYKPLTHVAKLSASESNEAKQGMVAHLDSSGEWRLGVTGHQMPCFLFNNEDDYDTGGGYDGGTPASTFDPFQSTAGLGDSGGIGALVATGGFEVASNKYSGSTFNPNDVLTAGSDGLVVVGTVKTHCLCGIVSKGLVSRPAGGNELWFWTYFLPVIS